MDCWHCGSDLIWGNDFDFEDYGYEGEGIISHLTCPNKQCNSWVEIYLPISKVEDEGN